MDMLIILGTSEVGISAMPLYKEPFIGCCEKN